MSDEKKVNFIDRDDKYTHLKKYFIESKDKPFDERFKFLFNFKKQGKQGLVGCISTKESMKESYVFKLSPDFDYIPVHEDLVMKGLEKIYHFCPNFCRSYGVINFTVDTDAYEGNPFSDKGLTQEVLLMEHIQGKMLNQFLNSRKTSEKIIFSIIKQVLLSVMIAQEKCKFTHYDLHCNNIIIQQCDKDEVIHYKFSDDFEIIIPTYGFYPVIIDFGFAFCDSLEGNTFWNTVAHSDVGFYTDRFDKISDFKLFLITMADDLRNYKFKTTENFKKFIRGIFSNIKVDFSTGWLQTRHRGTVEVVANMLNLPSFGLEIFLSSEFLCIDLLQSLIILPMEKQDYSHVLNAVKLFVKEFSKIEKDINDVTLQIYIFKKMIDYARDIRPYYLDGDKSVSGRATTTFKNCVLDVLYKTVKFIKVDPSVNYESLLCSLLIIGRSIEGILHDLMTIRSREKNRQEKGVGYTLEEIFYFIDYKFPTEYTFNVRSIIHGINVMDENRNDILLTNDDVLTINEKEWYDRGKLLGEIITDKMLLEKVMMGNDS